MRFILLFVLLVGCSVEPTPHTTPKPDPLVERCVQSRMERIVWESILDDTQNRWTDKAQEKKAEELRLQLQNLPESELRLYWLEQQRAVKRVQSELSTRKK